MSLASAMAPVLATLPTNSNGTCRLHTRPAEPTVLDPPPPLYLSIPPGADDDLPHVNY